eukprot:2779221-Lingulodinium_polyedra.AAC.1
MALDLPCVNFSADTRETWFRRRLGMAMRVANVGSVLMAALAPPMRSFLGKEPDGKLQTF